MFHLYAPTVVSGMLTEGARFNLSPTASITRSTSISMQIQAEQVRR
jgi:hypothetical protein